MISDAAAFLLELSDELSESAISAWWDDNEDIEDAEELDDFDDESELRMATKSEEDDEDVQEEEEEEEEGTKEEEISVHSGGDETLITQSLLSACSIAFGNKQ
jgi:hypothetical protein